MLPLGGNSESDKQQAAESAKLAALCAGAAGVLATVPSPLSAGLATVSAAIGLYATVQTQVSNDPPRQDWLTFPDEPPALVKSVIERREIAPRLRWSWQSDRDGAAALAAGTDEFVVASYLVSQALRSAERYAGAMATYLEDPQAVPHLLGVARAQRAVARAHLEPARVLHDSLFESPVSNAPNLRNTLVRQALTRGPTASELELARLDAVDVGLPAVRERLGADWPNCLPQEGEISLPIDYLLESGVDFLGASVPRPLDWLSVL